MHKRIYTGTKCVSHYWKYFLRRKSNFCSKINTKLVIAFFGKKKMEFVVNFELSCRADPTVIVDVACFGNLAIRHSFLPYICYVKKSIINILCVKFYGITFSTREHTSYSPTFVSNRLERNKLFVSLTLFLSSFIFLLFLFMFGNGWTFAMFARVFWINLEMFRFNGNIYQLFIFKFV